ncbi:MAG: YigZ family protein [Veillonellales bacterium]
MIANYYTVKGYSESEFKINKSRFITYVNRIETESDAAQFIDQIKKKHWNATHNCSAYTLGDQDQQQKADDDGEPSGTAGRPILEVIKKAAVKNTVIVVTRYFGGIKLGTGGLIRAYGKAAGNGLLTSGLVERVLHTRLAICLDYALQGSVENSLRTGGYIIENKKFAEKVTLITLVKYGEEAAFAKKICDLTADRASIRHLEPAYAEIPVNP